MRILKNQPAETSLHLARIGPGERGAKPELSVPKQDLFRLYFLAGFRPDFPKNSGWIKKTYQRISLFGKSPLRNPLSGTLSEDRGRNTTCEKTTLNDYSKL